MLEITSRRVSNFIFTRVRFSPEHPEKTCCFATSYACYTSIIKLIHSDEGLMLKMSHLKFSMVANSGCQFN